MSNDWPFMSKSSLVHGCTLQRLCYPFRHADALQPPLLQLSHRSSSAAIMPRPSAPEGDAKEVA